LDDGYQMLIVIGWIERLLKFHISCMGNRLTSCPGSDNMYGAVIVMFGLEWVDTLTGGVRVSNPSTQRFQVS